MFFDLSDIRVLLVAAIITVIAVLVSSTTKKSIYSLIVLLMYTLILIISAFGDFQYTNIITHYIVALIGIIITITTYILTNEIEIRRKIVSKVFKNKYKKK